MRYVVLDTNFLMLPVQFGIDIFGEIKRLVDEEYEIVTLNQVIEELKRIEKSRGESRDGKSARIALELTKRVKIEDAGNAGNADDAISLYASMHNAIVCTNDKELKKKLKNSGIEIISMRSKSHLEFII